MLGAGEVVADAADEVVGAGELVAVAAVSAAGADDEVVEDVAVGLAATVVVAAAADATVDETALLLDAFAETVVAAELPLDDPDGPQPVSNAAPAALPNNEMICRRCMDEMLGLDNAARCVCLYFIGEQPFDMLNCFTMPMTFSFRQYRISTCEESVHSESRNEILAELFFDARKKPAITGIKTNFFSASESKTGSLFSAHHDAPYFFRSLDITVLP